MFDPVTKAAIISGVISFLLGGGLIAYLKFFRDGKTESRSFAEGERLKLMEQVKVLNDAVSALSARVIPTNFPLWIKDAERKYIDVNAAWEIQIGSRLGLFKKDVLGKTDEQIYASTPETGVVLSELDDEATLSGGIAIRRGITFPKNPQKKIVIKEILIHDILGKPIYKGMAVPDV